MDSVPARTIQKFGWKPESWLKLVLRAWVLGLFLGYQVSGNLVYFCLRSLFFCVKPGFRYQGLLLRSGSGPYESFVGHSRALNPKRLQGEVVQAFEVSRELRLPLALAFEALLV